MFGESRKKFSTPLCNFVSPWIAAFSISITLAVLACLLAAAFRPGPLNSSEYVKLGKEGFLGHCDDCTTDVKYVMVCNGEEKQTWKWSGYQGPTGQIYYLETGLLAPSLDIGLWCNVQDLGNIMHGVHAIVWPIILSLWLIASAVSYDSFSDNIYTAGWTMQIRRSCIAIAIHGIFFFIIYMVASVVDESAMNTAAQTVYVVAMMSLALYIPGRLLLDQGQRYSGSFTKQAVMYTFVFGLPVIYVMILIQAFALEGRIFHRVSDMWTGVGFSVLFMILVKAVNIPIYYYFEQDYWAPDVPPPLPEPEIPQPREYSQNQALIPIDNQPLVPQPPADPEAPRALEDINPIIEPDAEVLGDPEYEEITI